MKKINLTIATLLLFLVVACSPEEYEAIDPNGLPSISDVADAIEISVDQGTNTVTFTLNKEGYNPVWIFEEHQPDTVIKTYSTENGYTRIFKQKGEHSVEVKVSNTNGVSDGSVVKTFQIDKTLLDESIIKKLCGGTLETSSKVWVWSSRGKGHFGCGPSGTIGLDWFSATPDQKKDWGMYDDTFTFKGDGTYIYNPGDGGTIYVNSNANIPEFTSFNTNDGLDYMANVEPRTSKWDYFTEGDDKFLTFSKKALLGYAPNLDIYNEPKFKLLTFSENKIVMVADNGTIAWHYEFIPKEVFDQGGTGTEVFDEGTDLDKSQYATGIVGKWTWEPAADGHFGCGPSYDEPIKWFSAKANAKEDWGLYDDIMTFKADGTYIFNPGSGGMVYVNKDHAKSFHPEFYKDDDLDYMVPVDEQTATYSLLEEDGDYYIILPPQTLFSYMGHSLMYNSPRYKITRMTTTMLEVVGYGDFIFWKYRLKKIN